MKAHYMFLLLTLTLGLGACAPQYPLVEDYPAAYQKKLWVVQHWNGIAAQVAERLASAITPLRPPNQPVVVYVERPKPVTEFDQAFHELLITQLLGHGLGVSEDPRHAGLLVRYNVQTVAHNLPHPPPPDDEVLVNTSVLLGNHYLVRTSDIYYITDYDIDQYLAQAPSTRVMEVVGP